MKKREIIRDVPVMYIGPTLKKCGLNSGNVFVGSLSENIQETLKNFPAMSELFVPIDENFSTIKKNIKIEGTKENIIYKKVSKELGGK